MPAMTSERSEKFLLVEMRLGEDLAQHLTARRAEGISYDRIARDVSATVGLYVSGQTVANWIAETEALAS